MQNDRILRLLGLCRRAGKLLSGQDTVITAVQSIIRFKILYFSLQCFYYIGANVGRI